MHNILQKPPGNLILNLAQLIAVSNYYYEMTKVCTKITGVIMYIMKMIASDL